MSNMDWIYESSAYKDYQNEASIGEKSLVIDDILEMADRCNASEKITELLEKDLDESYRCRDKVKAYKASVALLGSVLEAMLIAFLERKTEEPVYLDYNGKGLTLGSLIRVVEGYLKSPHKKEIIIAANEINKERICIHPHVCREREDKKETPLSSSVCKKLEENLCFIANKIQEEIKYCREHI